MTTINTVSADVAKLPCSALVIGVLPTEEGPQLAGDLLPKALVKALTPHLSALGMSGKPGMCQLVPAMGTKAGVLALVGIGAAPSTNELREAAGLAARTLDVTGTIAFALPAASDSEFEAIATGAALGTYRFTSYRKNVKVADEVLLVSAARPRSWAAPLRRARVIAESVAMARNLVNSAPNFLYPEAFAQHAQNEARGFRSVKVTVFDELQLEKLGCGGLLAVGQGSIRPPRLVRIEYTPPKFGRHIALVGKGITFDTGGISLKPPARMDEMKSDMGGAAAVCGAVFAAAKLQLKTRVTAWLALAENMPGGGAQRPADVITIRNGTTVEVLNTDAEGRLVLADALISAGLENPDAIIDVATLTGAQVVALGTRYAGVMGQAGLPTEVVAAADAVGETMWPMPLPRYLRDSLKSKVADLANIGSRDGGMLTAGVFLQEFVGNTPWAHIDIAGPAFNTAEPWGYTGKGGTGVAVRTLVGFLETQER